ncbi:WXG100 family type VII secretion target [Lentzea rhizosphaerae]|uniref:WXG100 family type VII secretion target n=1 Tax=Lentzea rhizosphaerae TaxID=2041025 RepID=A0ABV8BPX1_9PSEU
MTFTSLKGGKDWADPDNFAGAGLFESLPQTVDSMGRLGEGDAAELGLNAAALGLDALGVFMDPVGALATAGIGWLIEHLSFLREPLDWLAGNGDKIKAAVATWNQVSLAIAQIADEQNKAVQSQVGSWQEAAAERFRSSQNQLAAEMTAVSKSCAAVGEQVATAGTITAAVRGMLRDLVAMFIYEVIRNAIIALASSYVSLGSSIAAFSAWAVGRGAAVLGKITQQIAKLVKVITRIAGRLKTLFAKLGDVLSRLARFGRGGREVDVPSAPHAPATPKADALGDAGRRLEDWGNSRPTAGEGFDKLKQGGREFKDGYADAGNTWKDKYEEPYSRRVPSKPWQQDAVDAYTPFKPVTKADGSVTPHSVPNVMDGGYQIKLGADVIRETTKQDELQEQGIPDEQKKAFKRQQGHLDL